MSISLPKSVELNPQFAIAVAEIMESTITENGAACTVTTRDNGTGSGCSICLHGPQAQIVAALFDHLLTRSEMSGRGTSVFDAIVYDRVSPGDYMRGVAHILNPKNNLVAAVGQKPKIVDVVDTGPRIGTEDQS